MKLFIFPLVACLASLGLAAAVEPIPRSEAVDCLDGTDNVARSEVAVEGQGAVDNIEAGACGSRCSSSNQCHCGECIHGHCEFDPIRVDRSLPTEVAIEEQAAVDNIKVGDCGSRCSHSGECNCGWCIGGHCALRPMERDVGLQQGTCGSACNTTPDCRLCPRGRCFGGKCISTRGTALPLFGGFDVDGTVIAGFKKRSEETATTSDTATATSGQGSAVADDFSYNTKCNSTRDCKEELHSHCVDGRCVPTCMARDANCARGEAVMIEELVQDDRCILPCDHPEHCSPCDANVCRLGRCYLIRG